MANSTSANLKLTVQATGENSGTWGQITNTNLLILEQAIGGYEAVGVTSGATLVFTNGAISNGKNQILKLTGTITGNVNVTIPDSIEKAYIVENSTTGAHTVTFKTTSGSGATWGTTDKGIKFLYSNGTDVIDINADLSASTFQGNITTTTIKSGQIDVLTQNPVRLQDTTGGQYVGLRAPGTVSSSYTLTFPTATGTADQVLVTDGSGNLSFVDNTGGTAWQAVKTTGFTAAAGEGYFCNTTGGAFTMTLPSSPSIGDEISFIDYAGTFDTNNLTIGRNGKNIQGSAADLTVSVERAANTLVFVDNTQGWLLKAK